MLVAVSRRMRQQDAHYTAFMREEDPENADMHAANAPATVAVAPGVPFAFPLHDPFAHDEMVSQRERRGEKG